MNILWIPHNSWGSGRFQRDQYLIQQLHDRHRFFVLQWSSYIPHTLGHLVNPTTYFETLRSEQTEQPTCTVCKLPRLPDVPILSNRLRRRGLSVNTPFLRRLIRRLQKRHGLDLIVFASFGHAVGLPPSDLAVPLVFDYVDWCSTDVEVERECLTRSDAVVCVSEPLADRSRKFNDNTHLLTNGAQMDRFRTAKGDSVRRKLGLSQNKVVSLIGLTTSPSLYFIRAIQLAKRSEPTLKCLLVGRSDAVEEAVRKADPTGETFISVGSVPYCEVADYFAATDVGLYPGDDTDFFRYASPIKIFEYSAAGKPVVSSAVAELERIAWPNVAIRDPTAEAFAQGILHALASDFNQFPSDESLQQFDWETIARRFEAVLQSVVAT